MGGEVQQITDVCDLVGGLYDPDKKSGKEPVPGQVVYAPVPEPRHRAWIADVVRSAATDHDSAELHIRFHDPAVDYRGKKVRLPVHQLRLDETHELLLARSKMRLCLVLGRTSGVDVSSLPPGTQQNKARNAFPPFYYLAPLYTISNAAKTTAFGSVLSMRIRCLMYPEFFYFPRSGGIVTANSVARLDHLFVNQLAFGVDPQNLFIRDEALGLIIDQVKALYKIAPSEAYAEARQLLLDDLPEAFK